MQCKKCANNRDCWIKSAVAGKIKWYNLSEREQQIVIKSGSAECDYFADINDAGFTD